MADGISGDATSLGPLRDMNVVKFVRTTNHVSPLIMTTIYVNAGFIRTSTINAARTGSCTSNKETSLVSSVCIPNAKNVHLHEKKSLPSVCIQVRSGQVRGHSAEYCLDYSFLPSASTRYSFLQLSGLGRALWASGGEGSAK